jgi:hypothetical protein
MPWLKVVHVAMRDYHRRNIGRLAEALGKGSGVDDQFFALLFQYHTGMLVFG